MPKVFTAGISIANWLSKGNQQGGLMTKLQEKLFKEMFETVYQWGRVGIVVDHTCPTYQSYIRLILKQEKKSGFQNLKEILKNYKLPFQRRGEVNI
jgi:hypothetical protein